jgi:DNA gyrase subunit A
LLIAQKNIDDIIKLIKKSKGAAEASQELQHKYSLSQKQAQAILETKLQQLTSLEVEKLNKEERTLKELIEKLKTILGDEKEILKIIKRELNDLKKNFGDLRRTSIIGEIKQFEEKDLVIKKEVVVTLTEKGYAKRMDLKSYREQKRGGRGVIGSDLSTGDFVRQLIVCSTHDYLLFFTDKGRVFWLKAYQIPATERYGKGKALVNILNIKEERIQSVLPVKEFKDYVFMATQKGVVKKMQLELLSNPRSTGVNVMNLPATGDLVIGVKPVKDKQEVLLVTRKGQAIRFNSDEVRPMGRSSYGVTGIKLDNDAVVSLECLPVEKDSTTILTITEKGYGKRSNIDDYRVTGRAGKGVINLKVNEKVGDVVATVSVKEADSTIITTAKGIVIRSPVAQIRVMGRATQGVRLVKIQDQDKVTDLVKVEEAD